jgi:DNA-binding LacI/PurR family transcriptional regulator
MSTQAKPIEDPLYRRIQEALRGRIAQGEWSIGQALPNRRALCAEFGTTRVTLDKAIHELVRDGWLHSAAGSGTYVSAPGAVARARSVARKSRLTRHHYRIGVVLGPNGVPGASEEDIANYFFGPLYQGIRDGLCGKPVGVSYDHVEDGDYDGFCRRSTLDGVIIVAPQLRDLPMLRKLAASDIPFVAVAISSDTTPEDAALPCIDADNRRGAMEAVQHLLDLGHRQIALVNLALSHANHRDRMEGYQQAMARAGVLVHPDHLVLYPEYNLAVFQAQIEDWLKRVLNTPQQPTAIFVCDHLMTLVTLRALRQHGLRVPEDISVIGFDDPLSAADLTPPLTAVRQPTYRLGRRASSLLIRHLEEIGAHSALRGTEKLPTELIVRDSTCAPSC